MRIGFNPNKDQLLGKSPYFHQMVVPVYIPNQQDYFKDSFEILQICLESVFKTCHSKTYITVVDNGSCNEVSEYLDRLLQEQKIHELIHTTAIGKLNAVLKGLAGHHFPLVTVSDADVLFLSDWQKATYAVLEAFPKSGVVSPVPNSKSLRYYTSNAIWDTLMSKKSRFVKVNDPQAMTAFAESIGNPKLFKKIHLEKILAVAAQNTTAIIGAGHFVATYRSQCFDNYKQRFSKYSLGGDSEQLLLDEPASKLGLWRLSTDRNYAFHMGNVKEQWMTDELQKITSNAADFQDINLTIKTHAGLRNDFIMYFLPRIIFRKPFWQLYLRLKGLSRREANEY